MATTTTKAAALAVEIEDVADLWRALARARKVADTRSVLEVLGAVHLHAVGGELVMDATDMSTRVRVFCDVAAPKGFTALVPVTALDGAIKTLGRKGPGVLEAGAKTAYLRRGGRRLKMPYARIEDWPKCEFPEGEVIAHAVGYELAVAVETAWTAASQDETRPILNGVHIDTERRELVASDTYILAAARLPGVVDGTEHRKLNVSADALRMATKGLGDEEGAKLEVLCSEREWYDPTVPGQVKRALPHALCVRVSGAVYATRLIEGDFPNYTGLRPELRKDQRLMVRVAHAALYDSLNAACGALGTGRGAVLAVEILKTKMKLTGRAEDGSEFSDEVAISAERGGKVKRTFVIGIGAGLASRLVGVMDAEDELTLVMSTPLHAVELRSGEDWALLMPVRLSK